MFTKIGEEVDVLAQNISLKDGPVDVAVHVDYLREKPDYLAERVAALETGEATLVSASNGHANELAVLLLVGMP